MPLAYSRPSLSRRAVACERLGVAVAGALGGADTARERTFTLRRAAAGLLALLFVSPELLPVVLPVLRAARTRLARIVVDEAHLCGAWGVRPLTTSNRLPNLHTPAPTAPNPTPHTTNPNR